MVFFEKEWDNQPPVGSGVLYVERANYANKW